VSGSTELDAYHETFLPCNLATPTLVRARELKLKHGCHERWVLNPDFRAARGDVQHRTPPGCESPVDCHPRFLIGPSAGRTRFSSEQCHDWKRARGGIVADPDNSILLAEATDTELAPYKFRPTDPSFDLIMFTGGDLHRRHRSDSRHDAPMSCIDQTARRHTARLHGAPLAWPKPTLPTFSTLHGKPAPLFVQGFFWPALARTCKAEWGPNSTSCLGGFGSLRRGGR
jgi:hypothetical protein